MGEVFVFSSGLSFFTTILCLTRYKFYAVARDGGSQVLKKGAAYLLYVLNSSCYVFPEQTRLETLLIRLLNSFIVSIFRGICMYGFALFKYDMISSDFVHPTFMWFITV